MFDWISPKSIPLTVTHYQSNSDVVLRRCNRIEQLRGTNHLGPDVIRQKSRIAKARSDPIRGCVSLLINLNSGKIRRELYYKVNAYGENNCRNTAFESYYNYNAT